MISPDADPISALLAAPEDGVLAVIVGIDGPSYRPLGAYMAILEGGHRIGSLSSGCIESDIVHHASRALQSGQPHRVIYGRGSQYVDLDLPCGGQLDILLLPRPDRHILGILAKNQAGRIPCTLQINLTDGGMLVTDEGKASGGKSHFCILFEPDIFFYVFGKGPEANTFSALVQSAGFPNMLLSPDEETLDFARATGSITRHLTQITFPSDLHPDPWSAILLFFHDHDWEPPIIASALQSEAFYIGAQGSRRARDARHREIRALGATAQEVARLQGPIGLIPSARDARTLSIGVLAEVLQFARRVL